MSSPQVAQRRLLLPQAPPRLVHVVAQNLQTPALLVPASPLAGDLPPPRVGGRGVQRRTDGQREADEQYESDRLMRWARDGRRKGWWVDFDDVLSPDQHELIGYENEATACLAFAGPIVHGLLQTPAGMTLPAKSGSAAFASAIFALTWSTSARACSSRPSA